MRIRLAPFVLSEIKVALNLSARNSGRFLKNQFRFVQFSYAFSFSLRFVRFATGCFLLRKSSTAVKNYVSMECLIIFIYDTYSNIQLGEINKSQRLI